MPSSIAQCHTTARKSPRLSDSLAAVHTPWSEGKTTWMRRILASITKFGATRNIPAPLPPSPRPVTMGTRGRGWWHTMSPRQRTQGHRDCLPRGGVRPPSHEQERRPYSHPMSFSFVCCHLPAPRSSCLGAPSPRSRERAESLPFPRSRVGAEFPRSPAVVPLVKGESRVPFFPSVTGGSRVPSAPLVTGGSGVYSVTCSQPPGHGWAHGLPARGSSTSAPRRSVVPWRAAPPRPTPRLTS